MTDATSNCSLRVFLCHASNDKPVVRELYRRLRADGFEPWLDEEDLLPGQKWQDEIPKAVRDSDIVLVCLSQHSINKTGYVQKEIKFALDIADDQPDGTIFLIPLRLEQCDVPERLSHLQWVNFYDKGGYVRLLRALRKRAADLDAFATTAVSARPASPAAPESHGSSVSNVSGGVNVDANNVTVDNDMVGRDKIVQTTINIEHAMIIPSAGAVQESPVVQVSDHQVKKPAPDIRAWGDMQFVRVPAGKFLMGTKQRFSDERPQHTIEIPYDYWMAHYPVTNEQFAQFVTAAKYDFNQGEWQTKADHPVVNVSWRDAMAYCKWLNNTLRSELKDLTLRLPTEAEWEKAARGEYGNEWPWGNELDKTKCHYIGGGKADDTMPVGAYSPQGDSPYGAADMVGNVSEWCHSIYKPYPYQADDGRESETGNDVRVLRGGTFGSDMNFARCAYRDDGRPDNRRGYFGFRVMVSPCSCF